MACVGLHVFCSIIFFFLGYEPLSLSLSKNPQGQRMLVAIRIDGQEPVAERQEGSEGRTL